MLLAAGCGRVDTLRFAYANTGTPVEWPAGAASVELDLEISPDGRPWLPVSVDDNAPVPFLLQASAGAIALTGARAAGFGPGGTGALRLHGDLLPGIARGQEIRQRRLTLGALGMSNQSLLLVEPGDWPHGRPRGGAAGVLGYDLLRRFTIELDTDARRLSLYRPGGLDVGGMHTVQRLAVLDRVPYFEAWVESANRPAEWLRLQLEPGHPGGICLDRGGHSGMVTIAGRAIEVAAAPCPPADSARLQAARDGVFGPAALPGLVMAVDYQGGQIGFRLQ
ncbi:MAG: hypothetical protein ACNA8J_07535 [Gammaproteobacteria bacterium]